MSQTPDAIWKRMNLRVFLKDGGIAALTCTGLLPGFKLIPKAMAEQTENSVPNTNWADSKLGATVSASSYVADPPTWLPWGYGSGNVLGTNLFLGWQAKAEVIGAWIEIDLGQVRQISELWILLEPQPTDILGQYVYLTTFSREALLVAPRRIRIGFSGGTSFVTTLRQANYFQIINLPKPEQTSSVRITIEDVWPKPGGIEAGLGKIRIFSQPHSPSFDVTTHAMYDVQDGKVVQAAILTLINPGDVIPASRLQVSSGKEVPTIVPLEPIPARASVHQSLWIPAPFEDSEMAFQVSSQSMDFCCPQTLQVPKYQSYFDDGTFELNCTNHNDLGFLDTQEKTADFRSSALILPALDLMREHPEFVYTMECAAYLMEFLDRHPERREEVAERMRQGRFTWDASYVELIIPSVFRSLALQNR